MKISKRTLYKRIILVFLGIILLLVVLRIPIPFAFFPDGKVPPYIENQGKLKHIGAALYEYQKKNKGKFPPDIKSLLSSPNLYSLKGIPYVTNTDICNYEYRGVDLNIELDRMDPRMVLVYDREPYEQGRNVLFSDLHVELLSEKDFQKVLERDNMLRRAQGFYIKD
jgi:hypothetical protein